MPVTVSVCFSEWFRASPIFTGSFPSHLILAFRHLEQAATGLETFRGGVSRGISVAASISSIFMVSILSSYPSQRWRSWLKPLSCAKETAAATIIARFSREGRNAIARPVDYHDGLRPRLNWRPGEAEEAARLHVPAGHKVALRSQPQPYRCLTASRSVEG